MSQQEEAEAMFELYREQRYAELLSRISAHPGLSCITDSFGDSLLHLAAGGDNAVVLSALIQAGCNVDLPNSQGWTPLHEAARNCSKAAVLLLVQSGADIEAKAGNGWTPIMMASITRACSPVELVSLFHHLGATLDLNTAVRSGMNDYIKRLFVTDRHAQLAAPFPNDLLCDAVLYRNALLVQLLLDNGLDPNVVNRNNETPLHIACSDPYAPDSILYDLVTAGASLDCSINGVTPLSLLHQSGRTCMTTTLQSISRK